MNALPNREKVQSIFGSPYYHSSIFNRLSAILWDRSLRLLFPTTSDETRSQSSLQRHVSLRDVLSRTIRSNRAVLAHCFGTPCNFLWHCCCPFLLRNGRDILEYATKKVIENPLGKMMCFLNNTFFSYFRC